MVLTQFDYLKSLCSSHQFVILQEHWLLPENLNIFENEIPNISCHASSAVDSGQLLHGRPHGGCAIMWSTYIECTVTPIESQNKRICAVTIELNDMKLLLANVYMPTDTLYDLGNQLEFESVLSCLSSLANVCDPDGIIFGGDFNTDFSRVLSLHSKSLAAYVLDESLFEPRNQIDYSFESMSNRHRSFIDHFFISLNLSDSVSMYGVSHDGDNLSDHSSVFVKLSIVPKNVIIPECSSPQLKLCWRRANVEAIAEYRSKVTRCLNGIEVPRDVLNCIDSDCSEPDHKHAISRYCEDLVHCLSSCSMESIPKCKPPSSRAIPGWNEHVREYRDASIFWHSIWKKCGSPRKGWVSQIRRNARGEYHRAVRRVKRDRDKITANIMASSLSSNDRRDLWSECRKINRAKKPTPSSMNSVSGDDNIASVFARNYDSLYSSVSYNPLDMRSLERGIDDRIAHSCNEHQCYDHHSVDVTDLRKAVSLLKAGKSDGVLSTDHIIKAPDELLVHFSFLFTLMIKHGHCPSPFIQSTIVPIPKNSRKSLNDSANYRGIALNSPVSKLFELVILCRHREVLASSDMQFGYKKGMSTTSCSAVVDEVIQHYINGQNDVHVMLLDASKAFDCVHYVTLFNQLIDKGLCPLVCRVLLRMHLTQIVQVRWNAALSDPFGVSNGVRQGGILSPLLFSVYTDSMLSSLRESGAGCYLGHVFAGALAYADDVILLAPSKAALERMLSVADQSAKSLSLKFNSSKSQYLRFEAKPEGGNFSIDFMGDEVFSVREGTHLGRVLSTSQRGGGYIQHSIRDLFIRYNVLMSRFGHCSPEVRYHLFKVYCVGAYGSQLWDFDHPEVERYYTAWRKCIRRLWGLSPVTHCHLLPGICDDHSIEEQLLGRVVNFARSCANSPNVLTRLAFSRALRGSLSPLSSTISVICSKYNLARDFFTFRSAGPLPYTAPCYPNLVAAIRDFSTAAHSATGEDKIAFSAILDFMCTS